MGFGTTRARRRCAHLFPACLFMVGTKNGAHPTGPYAQNAFRVAFSPLSLGGRGLGRGGYSLKKPFSFNAVRKITPPLPRPLPRGERGQITPDLNCVRTVALTRGSTPKAGGGWVCRYRHTAGRFWAGRIKRRGTMSGQYGLVRMCCMTSDLRLSGQA
jgi:hypothetical protein